jgi:hypothetical protein
MKLAFFLGLHLLRSAECEVVSLKICRLIPAQSDRNGLWPVSLSLAELKRTIYVFKRYNTVLSKVDLSAREGYITALSVSRNNIYNIGRDFKKAVVA